MVLDNYKKYLEGLDVTDKEAEELVEAITVFVNNVLNEIFEENSQWKK